MTKRFVVRAMFFLCGVAGFSGVYAQSSKYTGGNGVHLSEVCDQDPPLEKNEYIDSRGISAAEYCALDIFTSATVTQQPCASDTSGIVEVTVDRAESGVFYFWWPSR